MVNNRSSREYQLAVPFFFKSHLRMAWLKFQSCATVQLEKMQKLEENVCRSHFCQWPLLKNPKLRKRVRILALNPVWAQNDSSLVSLKCSSERKILVWSSSQQRVEVTFLHNSHIGTVICTYFSFSLQVREKGTLHGFLVFEHS